MTSDNETYSPDIDMHLECSVSVRGLLKDEITIGELTSGVLRIFIDGRLSQEVTGQFKIKGIISNER